VYATALEQADAAAIELNIHTLPGDPLFTGHKPGRWPLVGLAEVFCTVRTGRSALLPPDLQVIP
jgi:hypothetical protein